MIKLSVIIPTYNKPEILKMTLESLVNQTFPKKRLEVIVVDDGSSAKAQRWIKSFLRHLNLNISFLTQAHKGPAAARNKGIKKAKGKIILIINDDTVATSSLLKRHSDFHQKNPAENFGLLGLVTWHPNLEITPFMYWLEHGGPYFSFSKIIGKEASWERLWTCNISLKRSFLLKNGLFDEKFPSAAWEDFELGYRLGRAGLKLFYDPEACGHHYHPTTLESIRNKMRANGEGVLILEKKLPREFLPPLAKYPHLALLLDKIFFCKLVFSFFERIALFLEKRINAGLLFDLVLLHYRVEGIGSSLKKKKVYN